MCPINAHPEYLEAEKKFYAAQTDEEKILALQEMIKTAPKHKGGETLRANIKTRYKKFKEKIEKEKKKSKSRGKQTGIKKEEMQAVLVGFTNSGKSSIFKILTNTRPKIASYGFTTTSPEQAILNYNGVRIQIIDLPPIGAEGFDSSVIYITDTLLIVIEKINEITELEEIIKKSKAKKIILFNKIDLYDESTKRKISETLKTKRYNYVLTSVINLEGIEELKEKLFNSFNKIRIYTKQPNKKNPDSDPMILNPLSTIEDAAKKALHGKSILVKQAKIWGPSSKFSGQKVGLKHVLKDKDIIELITR